MSLSVKVGRVFFKGKRYTLRVVKVTSSNCFFLPFKKESTLKGKSLLTLEFLLLEQISFHNELGEQESKREVTNVVSLVKRVANLPSVLTSFLHAEKKDRRVTFGAKRTFYDMLRTEMSVSLLVHAVQPIIICTHTQYSDAVGLLVI